MANCGLLLNDGSSFILLNDGGAILLNDNSCATEPLASTDTVAPLAQGAGWANQYQARIRQERWEQNQKRIEFLERKKSRIQLDIGELRYELSQESHPVRTKRLTARLNEAMDAIMTIEDELQALYGALNG